MADFLGLGQGGAQIILAIIMYLIYGKSQSTFIKNLALIAGIVLLLLGIGNILIGI